MWQEGTLLPDILISLGRVLGGFIAAALIGIPLGVATGTFQSIDGLFGPVGASSVRPVHPDGSSVRDRLTGNL